MNKIIYLLITVAFLSTSFSTDTFAQLTEKNAQTAISLKQFAKAEKIYVNLLEKSPENESYKLWIGRLMAWQSNFTNAHRVYDEVLLKNPNSSEALVGKIYLFMWKQKYDKANTYLLKVLKLKDSNIGVLIVGINLFYQQNKIKQAQKYLEAAKKIDNKNPEVLAFEKKLAEFKSIKNQAGCSQNLTPLNNTETLCNTQTSYVNGDNVLKLQLDTGKQLGETFKRVGVSWERKINDKTKSQINIKLSPNARFTNQLDLSAGISYKLTDKVSVSNNYQLWKSQNNTVQIVSPNVSLQIAKKTNLQTTYFKSWQTEKNSEKVNSAHSIFFYVNQNINKKTSINAGYSFGTESLKCDRCETFSNNINNSFVGFDFNPKPYIRTSLKYGITKNSLNSAQQFLGFSFQVTK